MHKCIPPHVTFFSEFGFMHVKKLIDLDQWMNGSGNDFKTVSLSFLVTFAKNFDAIFQDNSSCFQIFKQTSTLKQQVF